MTLRSSSSYFRPTCGSTTFWITSRFRRPKGRPWRRKRGAPKASLQISKSLGSSGCTDPNVKTWPYEPIPAPGALGAGPGLIMEYISRSDVALRPADVHDGSLGLNEPEAAP